MKIAQPGRGFLALAIGGFGSIRGAVAGALILGIGEQIFDLYVNPLFEQVAGLGDVYRALARLRVDGIGLLVVEQDLDLALSRSTRAYVLGNGRIVVSGLSGDIRDEARKAMLGLTGDGR
jgi:hypothetical protein